MLAEIPDAVKTKASIAPMKVTQWGSHILGLCKAVLWIIVQVFPSLSLLDIVSDSLDRCVQLESVRSRSSVRAYTSDPSLGQQGASSL